LDDPYDSQSSSVTPLDLRRYRAERLLRKEFEGMRGKVLTVVRSQLRGAGIALAAADLEACYAQAWHGLYSSVLEGEQIENPAGWLVRVTFRRAVDEHRAARATRVVEGEGKGSYPPASHGPQDWAGELDDKARLRHVFEGLRTRLGPREREAATLCYLQGLSRAEAAERMGVSEARMRKLMEGGGAGRQGVAAKMGELLDTVAAGGWCGEQGSLMRAYAFGILDPDGERQALAVAHCRECPACRAHVAALRGLASVLPLPLLPGLTGGGSAVTRGVTAKASSGISGSLTAKLAVTAVVVLGMGYAVMGSRAHGGTRRPSAPGGALSPAGSGLLLHVPFGVPRTRAHARAEHPAHVNTTSRAHHSRPASAPAGTRVASSPEFGPERASATTALAPTARSTVRTPSTPGGYPAGEFGLE
jgi:RNA polymerase sigma factor (sigma-70 family)